MHDVLQAIGLLLALTLFGYGIAANVRLFKQYGFARRHWRTAASALRHRPWTPIHFLGFGLFAWVLQICWPVNEIYIGASYFGVFAAMLLVLTIFCACILAGRGELFSFGLNTGFGAVGKKSLRPWRTGVTLYVAAMPIILLTSIFSASLLRVLGIETPQQDTVLLFRFSTFANRFWLGLSAVVLAPLLEEILFRALATSALLKIMSAGLAVVVASLIFAALHFNVGAFLPLFVFGLLLSMAYIMTGSIVVPIVIHAAFNLVSLILALLLGNGLA